MMRSRKEMYLPSNFQEACVANEIIWKSKISDDTIRKLVYLYSLGMEYYNLQGNENVEAYYRDKITEIWTNPSVMDYWDRNQIDLNLKKDLNLFPNYDKTKFRNINTISRLTTNESISSPKKKNLLTRREWSEIIARKILEVEIRWQKIDKKISNDIVSQISSFENRKRNKKKRKKEEQTPKHKDNTPQNEELSFDNFEERMALNQTTMRRRGSSIGRSKMLKEIEEYVEKNMKEMYVAWEEWKKSYLPEIEEAEESGFPDIVDGLKEDLESELENLTTQFEEQRLLEVESIRAKYCKKGNLK